MLGGDKFCSDPGVSSADRMLGWGRPVSPASRGPDFIYLQRSAKESHRRKAFQMFETPRCRRRLSGGKRERVRPGNELPESHTDWTGTCVTI